MTKRSSGNPPAVHERVAATFATQPAVRHLTTVLDAITDVVFMLDIEPGGYRFSYINTSFQRATGLEKAQVLGQRVDDVIPEPSLQLVLSKYEQAIRSGEPVRWQETSTYPSGVRHGEVMVTPIFDDSGTCRHLVGSVHDVTTVRENEERLRELAYTDSLTGLPNRRHFYMLLHERIATRPDGPLALLYVDLAIHYINDTYGHAHGDDVLHTAACRITQHLGDTALVGRVAGDELAILITPPDNERSLAELAGSILALLEAPFPLPGHETLITPSLGVSLYPDDTHDANDLVRFGNAAMHAAKVAGRGTVRFYDSAMATRQRSRISLRAELQHAFEQGHFQLYYQPQIDSRTGRCLSVEALLRWNRPGHGMVLPGVFIDVLEHSNLIVPVGYWVIESACRQIRAWLDQGLPAVSVSINVSPRQLAVQASSAQYLNNAPGSGPGEGLIARISQNLDRFGLRPDMLELELTETSLMADAERSVVLLEHCRELGVHVLIDDFGTGYSSLAYLRRLPIDMLKIDREFVRDIFTTGDSDGDGAAITDLIVNLAHHLGIGVVAEGVETQEQADYLRERGCDRLQGFHLARPMDAESLAAFLRKQPNHAAS